MPNPGRLGIAGRTAALLIIVAAAVSALGGAWLVREQARAERRLLEERADTLAVAMEGALIDAMDGHRPEGMGAVVEAVSRAANVEGLALADREGRVRFGGGTHPRAVELTSATRWEARRLVSVYPLPNDARCQSCHPATDATNGALWIALDTADLAPHLEQQGRRLWGLAALGAGALALVVMVVLRLGVGRPLGRLRRFAERLGSGDYTARPPKATAPEIHALGDALGTMAERLDRAHAQLEGRVRERTAELAQALAAAEAAREDRTEALQRLQAIVDSMADGVIFVDDADRIALANEAARKLRNLRGGPGRPITDCHPKSTHKVLERVMGYLRHGTDAGPGHSIIKEREGRYETTYAPVRTEDGTYLGTVMVIRDIAERRSLENRLLDAERLAGLGQMSAQVAHQLRNPLGAIDGAARYLERSVPGDEVREYTALIQGEVRRVGQFVEELLKVARPADPDYRPVKVNRLVEEAAVRAARGRGLDADAVSLDLAAQLPVLDVDRPMVVEALVNLIDNALESGETPQVEAISRFEADGGEGSVILEVRDRGVGLSEDQLEEVIRPFVTTKATGTGLGLVLVRRAAEQHRARFELSPREGGGTVARLEFPVRRVAPGAAEGPEAPGGAGAGAGAGEGAGAGSGGPGGAGSGGAGGSEDAAA